VSAQEMMWTLHAPSSASPSICARGEDFSATGTRELA
jgi:hypothetical protein